MTGQRTSLCIIEKAFFVARLRKLEQLNGISNFVYFILQHIVEMKIYKSVHFTC